MSRSIVSGMTGAALACAALMAGAAPAARAADLAAPMRMAAPAAEPMVEWGSGWYLRGDIGVSDDKRDPMMRLPGAVQGGGKSATSVGADFGVGYQFSDYFRTDATVGTGRVIKQKLTSTYNCFYIPLGQNGACDETARVQVNRVPMLVNAYADLGNYGGLRPYLGAGAGVTAMEAKWDRSAVFNGSLPFSYANFPATYGQSPNVGKKAKWNFTYALMAGLGYDLRDGLTLDVGYRFLDMGAVKIPNAGQGVAGKQREHEVRVGLRYRID